MPVLRSTEPNDITSVTGSGYQDLEIRKMNSENDVSSLEEAHVDVGDFIEMYSNLSYLNI